MKYYVYELIDPRDGQPFYVGKGQRYRYLAHVKEAVSGKTGQKCDRIRDILNSGETVKHSIVKWFVDEQDAYDYEVERIFELGIENLTNISLGGNGPVTKRWDGSWTETTVRGLRRRLLRAIRLIVETGGFVVILGNYSEDFTLPVINMIKKMMTDIGRERFYEILGCR